MVTLRQVRIDQSASVICQTRICRSNDFSFSILSIPYYTSINSTLPLFFFLLSYTTPSLEKYNTHGKISKP